MIRINFDKAKEIGHEIRRFKRAAEFAPLDIKVSIPSEAVAAEAARSEIRRKYEIIQQNINASISLDELNQIVKNL
jgi:hypothetical protein